jgi:hypothetical protein
MKARKNRRTMKARKKMKQSMEDKYGNKMSTPELSLEYNEEENDFYQAVIEIYGLDTNGPSYEGRVYVNNPKADGKTPLDESAGYVGSFDIFGHDGCWGDEGHCDVLPDRPYDSRIHSHTDPVYKSIRATKAIKKCVKSKSKITITIVPKIFGGQRMSDAKDVVKCERVRITCYENPAKLRNSA